MSFRLVYLPKPITLIIRNGSSNCFALSRSARIAFSPPSPSSPRHRRRNIRFPAAPPSVTIAGAAATLYDITSGAAAAAAAAGPLFFADRRRPHRRTYRGLPWLPDRVLDAPPPFFFFSPFRHRTRIRSYLASHSPHRRLHYLSAANRRYIYVLITLSPPPLERVRDVCFFLITRAHSSRISPPVKSYSP